MFETFDQVTNDEWECKFENLKIRRQNQIQYLFIILKRKSFQISLIIV